MPNPTPTKRPEEYAAQAEGCLAEAGSLEQNYPDPVPEDARARIQNKLLEAKVYGDLANAAATREQALATLRVWQVLEQIEKNLGFGLGAIAGGLRQLTDVPAPTAEAGT